jgi:hypothetical protein
MIQVTEEMVRAAHHVLPGISNRMRVRAAIEAALAVAPGQQAELPVSPRIVLHVDEEQLRADVAAALAPYTAALEEPHVTEAGLDGPGVTDPTGQPTITVVEPQLHPALERQLVVGSLSDIARRHGVARSTVAGWVKNRQRNGMPEPIEDGAYDLAAVDAWHSAWKGDGDAA